MKLRYFFTLSSNVVLKRLCLVLIAFTSSLAIAATSLNTFGTSTESAGWWFYNGAEFPGARGSFVISSSTAGGDSYGELRYDFRPPSPLPAQYDPHYVQVTRSLTVAESSGDRTRLRFRTQKSRPEIGFNVRWVDASGQTLQKPVSSREALEQTAPGLHPAVVDLRTAPMFWGGAGDGKTQFPLRSISFICDATDFRDSGWVRFDDVEFLDEPAAAPTTFTNGVDLAAWRFGNGGEFPGARGSLVHEVIGGVARLNYDFTQPPNWTGIFNPAYVEAWRALPANATGVRFRFAASSRDIAVRLRYLDSAGQTFQTVITHRGAGPAPGQWTEASHSFVPVEGHWSGPNDGVVHFPIKRVSIVLHASNRRDTGYLKIDDFTVTSDPLPTVDLGSGSLVTPSWGTGPLMDRAGVSIHFTSDNRAMDAIRAAGLRWVRKDAHWDHIERVAGQYNFSTFDTLVNAAEQRGLTTLAILDYGNTVHTGGAMSPPRTTAALLAYENYCAAIASRYAGRKVVFEVWNEPDVAGFWGGSPNATEFSKLLARGIAGVKRGNPNAEVISGGLSSVYSVTYKFYHTMLESGSLAGAAGMGAHLYGCAYPEEQWGNVLRLKSMAAAGNGGVLWCSEWGFSSTDMSPSRNGHDAAGRHIQAGMAVRQLFLGWWANLPVTVLYDIMDDGTNPAEPEHNYGLLARDYSEKPAMRAVKKFLAVSQERRLAGLLKPVGLPAGMHVARLDGSTDAVYMVWADEGTPVSVLAIGNLRATAVDMYGNRIALIKSGARLAVPINSGTGPIYVTIPLY